VKTTFLASVAVGLIVELAAAGVASASTNLIQNGSFETAGDGTFTSSTGVSDWTLSGTVGDLYYPVDIQYNQASGYPTGAQGESVPVDDAASLSPDGPGSHGVYFVSDQASNVAINQTVYLTPGSYDIGFDSYFTYNGFDQPGDATLVANIAGVELANIDFDSIEPGVWTTHSGEADILTAGNYQVSFVFNTPNAPENAKDVVIDQAYIIGSATGGGTPISGAPEPGTWALMLGGIGMIGGMLRIARARRREKLFAAVATA